MNTESIPPQDVQRILQNLQSDDTEILRSAAFAAGDCKLAESVDLLCKGIASANIGVQEAAEYALRKIRGPRTVRSLLPLLRSDDAPLRNIAMDVLREIGADDLDVLHPLLHDADCDMRIFIADILGSTKSRKSVASLCDSLLKDPEVNVRYQAAVSLGSLAFPEAVECLRLAMMDEEWVQFSVVEALTKIRADSTVTALTQALSNCSPLVASIIIDALGEMGNIKAVPLLFKSLESASVPLRHKTVKSIVKILGGRSLSLLNPKDHTRFRDYLLDTLNDEDESVLMAALSGLSVMGDDAATKAIFRLMTRMNPDLHQDLIQAATQTIASIGFNQSFVDALHAKNNDMLVHVAVDASLLMDDTRHIQHIKEIFWQHDRDIQRAAAVRLARIAGPDDVPFFLDLLDRHTDGDVLKAALFFLGNRMKAEQATEKLFSMLAHPYDDVKEAALEACIALQTPQSTEHFKQLFKENEPRLRAMAVYALGRQNFADNLPELRAALEDEDAHVRQVAVEVFGASGSCNSVYLSLLLPRLHDENKDVRISVVSLLGTCNSPEVLPPLLSALNDQDDWVRIRAVEALGHLKATAAVPHLVQMLDSSNPMLTFKIIDTLGRIGGKIAFRALLGMIDHEDPEIQHVAAEAVSSIQAEHE
ncbi:MAG: HEAT repeat domain-containing protein [Deltaproteobacteria bacterium]|jgi:HEAT repeat protein|nr:HEAT repeat domain-containing protein [Deltaproteobacteria bacterium]